MQNYQADLELSLLHIKQLEQRIADQQARIEYLRKIGASTELADQLLRSLQETLGLIKQHVAVLTGPIEPDKAST